MAMPYPAYGAPRPPPNNDYPSSSYPPNGLFNPSSVSSFNSPSKGPHDIRNISRTPSPTPSETKALSGGLLNWKEMANWRFWIRREWLGYYIALTIILTLTALISIYHTQIVDWLTPVTKWLHGLRFGFLVPIGILFVISFPPLFGHEIVAILCGLVWGLWIGFGIVCAGTFVGEVGNFYAFKYCCRARGEKMERTQIPYACLARCVRTGGFKIALIARFSAIPGHFTTAVFSTCGMGIFTFSIAAILSLPKQFITVYLGVILEQSGEGTTTTKSRIISDSVLALTFLVTLLAMWYIFHQMSLVKPAVIYDRRKARQGKQMQVDLYAQPNLNDSDSSVGTFDPRASLSDIPLTANKSQGGSQHPRYDYEQQQKQRQYADWVAQQQRQQYGEQHQQWDARGRAVGYMPGPAPQVMYAPQPQRSGRAEVQPGAYQPGDAEVYGHGRTTAFARQETSDEVGWDMQMRERPQQQMLPPQSRQYTQSPPQQYQSPHQQYRSPPQPGTPTQAQYASYQPQAGAAAGMTSAPLPTPPYPVSPFADPEPGHAHSVEPTDASYHTAYGSDEDGSEDTHVPAQARAFSPPPPSYRTDVR
ncbi:hypothetical protein DFH07DRAFT_842599 [Mycena maculata]|uniref:Golgi apparatus membrane protein TVP38 n=1 Tax=Mycena maculata TaxID=230809 RepID=A0AAD7I7C6_9AGAR|nr:hypothetical protein DFH07DRAFT_842599 [Mycena maculata]